MKLGFGFYKHMLNQEYYDFAKQCGATHAIVHLVDYFNKGTNNKGSNQPIGDLNGWGVSENNKIWSVEYLLSIKKELNDNGLELVGVENFEPLQWYDILLDGPKKYEQIENLKTTIRNIGKAGIKIMGYNFSITSVTGRIKNNIARGNAETVGMNGINEIISAPLKKGMIWNMWYNQSLNGILETISNEDLWKRLEFLLKELVPVAKEANVILAAHPDDPPLKTVRKQPKLVTQHYMYQKLLDIIPSDNSKLEFCIGTLAEMSEGDIYECIDKYSKQRDIAYIHMRNVKGKVPYYHETFIDNGDIDMDKIFSILKKNHYQGVLIPDHTPQLSCKAPWEAGMAYAMGYLNAKIKQYK